MQSHLKEVIIEFDHIFYSEGSNNDEIPNEIRENGNIYGIRKPLFAELI